jgi:hypothetical protein
MTLEDSVLIELADQVILVAEIAIDGACRHLGFLGDHGNGKAVEAARRGSRELLRKCVLSYPWLSEVND